MTDDERLDREVKKEYHFQVSISDWLSGIRRVGNKTFPSTKPFFGMLFTHCYQGRNESEGFFLKRLGVKAGMSDLLHWWPHPKKELLIELSKKYDVDIPLYECGFLELKSETGKLSSPQKKIQGICHYLGIKWATAKTEREVIAAYRKWGLNPSHTAIQTPSYMTKEDKDRAVFNMYAPLKPADSD